MEKPKMNSGVENQFIMYVPDNNERPLYDDSELKNGAENLTSQENTAENKTEIAQETVTKLSELAIRSEVAPPDTK